MPTTASYPSHLQQAVQLSYSLILCFIVTLCSANISAKEPQATSQNIQSNKLLILGDSLSAGFMLNQGDEWPALLQSKLDSSQSKIFVVNASISGETSLGGVSRIKPLLEQHNPRWLILELGANDGLQGKSIKSMHYNLSEIIHIAQQQNTQVILLGMHIPPNYGKRYSQSFHQVFSSLSEEFKITFHPFFLEGIAGKPKLNLADGIHPTAEAQSLVLNNIWTILKPILLTNH